MSEKDKGLIGNEQIEDGIKQLRENFTDESLAVVLTTIRNRMNDNGQFVIAVDAAAENTVASSNLSLKTVSYEGKNWFVAFTSFEEELKGKTNVVSCFLADISGIFEMTINSPQVEGVILNPFGNMMTLNKQIISVIKG